VKQNGIEVVSALILKGITWNVGMERRTLRITAVSRKSYNNSLIGSTTSFT